MLADACRARQSTADAKGDVCTERQSDFLECSGR